MHHVETNQVLRHEVFDDSAAIIANESLHEDLRITPLMRRVVSQQRDEARGVGAHKRFLIELVNIVLIMLFGADPFKVGTIAVFREEDGCLRFFAACLFLQRLAHGDAHALEEYFFEGHEPRDAIFIIARHPKVWHESHFV